MEAWSVPGTQQAFLPIMRARRTSTSWMVLLSMCPMCSTPVTLGGGMTTVYGSRPSGVEWNNWWSSQYWYHFDSMSVGLYLLASSISIGFWGREN